MKTLKEALMKAGEQASEHDRDYWSHFLASLESNGYCIVPMEATDGMGANGAAAIRDFYSEKGNYPRTKAMWRRAIAARPKLGD